ncbi:hypothetical protein ID866_9973 [Astraeus odoratus]|nr:hypothetical protein ID866_9973 [Astraeus odoratus]
MNARSQAEMLRQQQQSLQPIPSVSMNSNPHFLPTQQQPRQQQQPPGHMGLMPNATNPSMSMLGGGAQNNPNPLPMSTPRYPMPQQNALQQGQSPQINPSAAAAGAAHMSALGHNALQGVPFAPAMMPQAPNGVPVRRTQSHPQGLNQSVSHVPSMIAPQQGVNGMNMNMAMNPQASLSGQLRQPGQQGMMARIPGSMPGSMSPDIIGRQQNPPGVPQNSLRPGGQPQLMNSLAQPSGLQQAGLQQSISQNAFQQPVSHPHHAPSLTSSPRPGVHPQQHAASNMMMNNPGSSQGSGPRPMSHGENAFVGLPNSQFPPNMVPGSARIPNANPSFPFAPSVAQNEGLEIQPSMGDSLGGSTNPQMRSGFQPTPAQQFEQLQQTENFGAPFNLQSQGNGPPTRSPSHPGGVHGNSMPPRSMQPPTQHAPHQSDPITGHVQQQPQRPQSQPQGPPGRPPSQAGPSHTPRSSQSQLPPSSLHPTARMASQTQPQASPLQQRQSPSVQPPIAPRPPQGPSANPSSVNAAPSEPGTSQPRPTVIPRNVVAPPVGIGQGTIRLLQFSGQLSNENPNKQQLSFWDALVKEYFTPKAIMKITLWKDNQKVEAKPLEVGVPILPRFFLVTTQSGVKSMTLSLDGARERLCAQHHAVVECVSAVWTYRYDNGYIVTLRGPLTVHVVIFPHTNPTPAQQYPFTLKFELFQFDANVHEKFIVLDSIAGQRSLESPKTPRTRNNPTPSPNSGSSNQRTEEDRQREEPRVLISNASIPGEPVNAFGIPQVTMRCLELAEGGRWVATLVLIGLELAKKLREGHHHTTPNGAFGGLSATGPGGYGAVAVSPAVTLHPGMSMASSTHSGPSSSSPQSAPPSADTPQKQSKPPTSGPTAPTPNQPPAPSQAGLTTPSMPAASLKRKPNDINSSPTTTNAEPQSKRTRKGPKRNP